MLTPRQLSFPSWLPFNSMPLLVNVACNFMHVCGWAGGHFVHKCHTTISALPQLSHISIRVGQKDCFSRFLPSDFTQETRGRSSLLHHHLKHTGSVYFLILSLHHVAKYRNPISGTPSIRACHVLTEAKVHLDFNACQMGNCSHTIVHPSPDYSQKINSMLKTPWCRNWHFLFIFSHHLFSACTPSTVPSLHSHCLPAPLSIAVIRLSLQRSNRNFQKLVYLPSIIELP